MNPAYAARFINVKSVRSTPASTPVIYLPQRYLPYTHTSVNIISMNGITVFFSYSTRTQAISTDTKLYLSCIPVKKIRQV